MSTLTVRIEERDRLALEQHARAAGVSVSELIRGQIAELLGRGRSERDQRAPQSLTFVERRTLALLHRLLARMIDLDGGDDGSTKDGTRAQQTELADVLEDGYATEYEREFSAIEPEMPRSEGNLVMDLFDMFTTIRNSLTVDAAAEVGDASASRLQFRGFDSHDRREARMLYFGRDLIAAGRWPNLADLFSASNDHGESHAPLLGAYLRMLEAYTPIYKELLRVHFQSGGPTKLNARALRTIAEAAVHPDRR